jgi:CMP-N,N'-diacetyllegionaminic acid synthase
MINGLNILAVIPARGGSKGVPLKNLREVGGVPIVELAAQVASQANYIDRIVVSTDHEGIAEAAIKGGADAPFRRPEELSGDMISDLQVLTHALLEMESLDDKKYDILVMLQPTSPMRTPKHVVDTVEKLVNDDLDAVWTISEAESKSHPLKQLTLQNGTLNYYDPKGKGIIARQQLQPVYHRNGIAYAISRRCLLEKKNIMGDACGAVICDGDFISIDTELDFMLTDYFLKLKSNSELESQ